MGRRAAGHLLQRDGPRTRLTATFDPTDRDPRTSETRTAAPRGTQRRPGSQIHIDTSPTSPKTVDNNSHERPGLDAQDT